MSIVNSPYSSSSSGDFVIMKFMIPILFILILMVLGGGLIHHYHKDRLKLYKNNLGLEKASLVYSDDYNELSRTVLPFRKSVFSMRESTIWLYRKKELNIFLTANNKNDVRFWFQPKTILTDIHIVLDSIKNNRLISNMKQRKLPPQKISLEGDFPNYFTLYCDEGQQVLALQIIAPDLMEYLIDHAMLIDIEIINGQIAVIVRGASKSFDSINEAIQVVFQLNKLFVAVAKVNRI